MIATGSHASDRPAAGAGGLREADLQAPAIGDFYKRYRGENLPDKEFMVNAAVDSFKVKRSLLLFQTFLAITRCSAKPS